MQLTKRVRATTLVVTIGAASVLAQDATHHPVTTLESTAPSATPPVRPALEAMEPGMPMGQGHMMMQPGSAGGRGMNPARLQSPDWTILGGGLVLDALKPPPRDGAVAISQDRTIGVNGGDDWNRSKLSEIGWRAAGMRSAGRCDICDGCFGVQQERRILP
jgi:hypothetical protein